MVAVGLVSFIGGYVGAVTGLTFLPFDPHHALAQLGGATLAVVGLSVATGRGGRR